MIVGGAEINFDEPSISLLQLPGLKMDAQFSMLTPCDNMPIETVKELRRERLLSFAENYQPDCLIVELYPFGRKNFRFELDPLLDLLSEKGCAVFCSLRDILVEKVEGREKFEQRVVTTMNRFFDGLLIHADPDLVTLDQTFSKTDAITTAIHYTGFISPKPAPGARNRIRKEMNLDEKDKLVVASIGSGSVGLELIEAAIRGVNRLVADQTNVSLQVFAGPYLPESSYNELCESRSTRIRVERFTTHFIDWLAAADLSISMAGYNTSMNVLRAGVPALMYPFDQNREQRMRISKISACANIRLLEQTDLVTETLAGCIETMLERQRFTSSIMLDGTARTAAIIERHLNP
jgi:predicted glycosyltransferase